MASIIIDSAVLRPISEAGDTTTFTVELGAIPSSAVVLALSSSNSGEVTLEPAALVFQGDDWNRPQTVTLIAADDSEVDDDQISTITVDVLFSNDAAYTALSPETFDVITTDDESAGFNLSQTTATVEEDGTGENVTVSLTGQPISDVVFTISSNDTGEVTAAPTILTFTPETWLTPQTISLTGVDDGIADGNQASAVTVSVDNANSDDAFDDLEDQTVTATTTDDERPEFSLNQTSVTVSEDGLTTDNITLTLDAEPLSDVVLNIVVADSGEVWVSSSSITLNSTNWDTGVEVTLSGADDSVADGDQTTTVSVSVDATNSDDAFDNAASQDITVTTIDSTECFLSGTYILTDHGEVPVENLKIGDRVLTAEGVSEPIKWVGRQTLEPSHLKYPLRGYPILIKTGALGHNLPHRDLYVSPDHALWVEGLLINAGALVNDRSILKTEPTAPFSYHHIELCRHSLLVAEGIAAESYLPQKEDRSWYDNGGEYETLYLHNCIFAYWPMKYARVSSKRQLPRFVSKPLEKRAEALFGTHAALG